MKHYRALISIPVQAESDDEAQDLAERRAADIAEGHLELLGAVEEGQMQIRRVVSADPWLARQLPLDWKA